MRFIKNVLVAAGDLILVELLNTLFFEVVVHDGLLTVKNFVELKNVTALAGSVSSAGGRNVAEFVEDGVLTRFGVFNLTDDEVTTIFEAAFLTSIKSKELRLNDVFVEVIFFHGTERTSLIGIDSDEVDHRVKVNLLFENFILTHDTLDDSERNTVQGAISFSGSSTDGARVVFVNTVSETEESTHTLNQSVLRFFTTAQDISNCTLSNDVKVIELAAFVVDFVTSGVLETLVALFQLTDFIRLEGREDRETKDESIERLEFGNFLPVEGHGFQFDESSINLFTDFIVITIINVTVALVIHQELLLGFQQRRSSTLGVDGLNNFRELGL